MKYLALVWYGAMCVAFGWWLALGERTPEMQDAGQRSRR